MHCPCGTKKDYIDCCSPILEGKIIAPTPEALMRSRYTAYTKGNTDYLQSTMREPASENFNPEETRRFARRAKWLDLTILDAPPAVESIGFVEFVARYSLSNKVHVMHERSEFRQSDGRWYYVNQHPPATGCACH